MRKMCSLKSPTSNPQYFNNLLHAQVEIENSYKYMAPKFIIFHPRSEFFCRGIPKALNVEFLSDKMLYGSCIFFIADSTRISSWKKKVHRFRLPNIQTYYSFYQRMLYSNPHPHWRFEQAIMILAIEVLIQRLHLKWERMTVKHPLIERIVSLDVGQTKPVDFFFQLEILVESAMKNMHEPNSIFIWKKLAFSFKLAELVFERGQACVIAPKSLQ